VENIETRTDYQDTKFEELRNFNTTSCSNDYYTFDDSNPFSKLINVLALNFPLVGVYDYVTCLDVLSFKSSTQSPKVPI
jgi:hypothetical protein